MGCEKVYEEKNKKENFTNPCDGAINSRIFGNKCVSWNNDTTLKKGVGMFVSDSTTAPSESGHTVRSGQRDTVFTELGEVIEKVRPKLNILQYLFF